MQDHLLPHDLCQCYHLKIIFPEVQHMVLIDTEWFCSSKWRQLEEITNSEYGQSTKRFLVSFYLLQSPVHICNNCFDTIEISSIIKMCALEGLPSFHPSCFPGLGKEASSFLGASKDSAVFFLRY